MKTQDEFHARASARGQRRRCAPATAIRRCSSPADKPTVILVVGVNGAGKTTFIGKLAATLPRARGKRVVVAAGDTFRAGAIDQLRVWAERIGRGVHRRRSPAPIPPPSRSTRSTPRSHARRRRVIIDTAGRLHTSEGLMTELKKVARVIAKRMPDAPHETLLVLDGTIGQNAVQQAKTFSAAVPITGLVVTKLDGTARGGVVVAVHEAIDVPVKFLGVGESERRSRAVFDAAEFAQELLGRASERGDARAARRASPARHAGHLPQGGRTGARRGAASGSASSPRAICSTTSRIATRTRAPSRRSRRSRPGWRDGRRDASISKGVHPDAEGPANLPGRAAGRHRDDRGVVARPAVPRSHDREGRRPARDRDRALLPRPPAPAARVRQPRRRRRRHRRGDACSPSIRRPKGCRSRSSAGSSTRTSTSCSPLVTEYLPPDVLRGADVPSHRATRCAWCTARRRSPRRCEGRARLAFEELLFVQLLQQRAKALAREKRARHRVREPARADDAAARGAAVPAHRRADARACARSSPTCAATAACSACCRATSAAARRSSRCSPRCSRWRTAIRRRSWRRPSCSPSSTRAR